MKLENAEDFDRIKSCIKCGNIFDKNEGDMLLPETTGIVSGIARSIEIISGDTAKYRFVCGGCQRKLRIRKKLLWGGLIFLLALIFVLTQLGILE